MKSFLYILLVINFLLIIIYLIKQRYDKRRVLSPIKTPVKEEFYNLDETWGDNLKNSGYAIIPDIINVEETIKLKNYVYDQVESDSLDLSPINNPKRRLDMIIPIEDIPKGIIKTVWGKLGNVLSKYDENPNVIECSCFINFPNSSPQTWHSDVDTTNMKAENTKLFTIGILLEDTDKSMGALEVIDKSHIEDINKKLHQRECNLQLQSVCGYFHNDVEYTSCTGNRGTVIIWDARVKHRGGANYSNKVRNMFYFSLLCGTSDIPEGITHSIEDKYKEKILKINDI